MTATITGPGTDTLTDTATLSPTAAPTLTVDFPAITLHDRCDACSQHAVSQFFVGDTRMLLCGHHTRTSLPMINAKGYLAEIPDEYAFQFTTAENAKRAQDYSARDAGSA